MPRFNLYGRPVNEAERQQGGQPDNQPDRNENQQSEQTSGDITPLNEPSSVPQVSPAETQGDEASTTANTSITLAAVTAEESNRLEAQATAVLKKQTKKRKKKDDDDKDDLGDDFFSTDKIAPRANHSKRKKQADDVSSFVRICESCHRRYTMTDLNATQCEACLTFPSKKPKSRSRKVANALKADQNNTSVPTLTTFCVRVLANYIEYVEQVHHAHAFLCISNMRSLVTSQQRQKSRLQRFSLVGVK